MYSPARQCNTFWFGINDLGRIFDKGDGWDDASEAAADQAYKRIFERYRALLQTLRARNGAANFLLFDVAPLQRTMRVLKLGKGKYAKCTTALVEDFSGRIAKFAKTVEGQSSGLRVWQLDANSGFDRALNEPRKFPELAAVGGHQEL